MIELFPSTRVVSSHTSINPNLYYILNNLISVTSYHVSEYRCVLLAIRDKLSGFTASRINLSPFI